MGQVPEIEITEEEYTGFKKARKILSNALSIEEKYEIVISNYLDFEKQILHATAGSMVRGQDYSDFFELRLGLNIRLVNLLTAVKLYVDQLNQNVQKCVPEVLDAKEKVKSYFTNEFENNKEYRFMAELRDHVQHKGIPVHSTELCTRRTSLNSDGLLEYSVEVASLRSLLKEDCKFKNKVLAECDEKIDLKATTRVYIESMSNVHESARSLIAESVSKSRALIEDARCRYAAEYSKGLKGLYACKRDGSRLEFSVPLLLEWDDIRVKLQERNRKLTNLRKRYVTGRIKPS